MKVRAIRILVPPLELILRLAESRYSLFRRALTSASPALLARLGTWRAVYAADSARRRVPRNRRRRVLREMEPFEWNAMQS